MDRARPATRHAERRPGDSTMHVAQIFAPPSLSVVIQCFNEEPSLVELHLRVSAACQASAGHLYEIILVDDGSSDDTQPLMRTLADKDPHVIAVTLARN